MCETITRLLTAVFFFFFFINAALQTSRVLQLCLIDVLRYYAIDIFIFRKCIGHLTVVFSFTLVLFLPYNRFKALFFLLNNRWVQPSSSLENWSNTECVRGGGVLWDSRLVFCWPQKEKLFWFLWHSQNIFGTLVYHTEMMDRVQSWSRHDLCKSSLL